MKVAFYGSFIGIVATIIWFATQFFIPGSFLNISFSVIHDFFVFPLQFMFDVVDVVFSLSYSLSDNGKLYNGMIILLGPICVGFAYGCIVKLSASRILFLVSKTRKTITFYSRVLIIAGSIIMVVIIFQFINIMLNRLIMPQYYISRFNSLDLRVKVVSAEALIRKGGFISPYLAREYCKRSSIEEKLGILYVLGRIGGESTLDLILTEVKDKNPPIRDAAIKSLQRMTPHTMEGTEYPIKRYNSIANWPIRKKVISVLLDVLNDKHRVYGAFPDSSYFETEEVRYQVLEYIKGFFGHDGFDAKMLERPDTIEEWTLIIESIQKYWQENEPYLYWVDSDMRSLSYKILVINNMAKSRGIPVDEISGIPGK